MKLNLGCGHNPLPGWTNVDIRPGPGVDVLLDQSEPDALSDFGDGEAEVVRADALLEHLPWWERLVQEVARVLKTGGLFFVRVPTGWDYYPYHVRAFGPRTMDPFCVNVRRFTSDLRCAWNSGDGSCEFDGMRAFVLEDRWVEYLYPFAWHLAQRLGPAVYRIPIGRKASLNWRLRRA